MAGNQFNASRMDETLPVKGCLGRLPCSLQGKHRAVEKHGNSTSSHRAKLVSKPSAVVLPSPRHNLEVVQSKSADRPRSPMRGNMNNSRTRHEAIKGQLSLSFRINAGIIIVQVLEAKNLKVRSTFANGDSYYIAIELLSDNDDGTRQTTKSVFSENPVFNEEFALRRNFSASSRLLISLYKSSGNGCDEMIGCMSFGVSNLLQKYSTNSDSDTYVLLNRSLGMKKHLRSNQIKHLNVLANMTGVSAFSSEMNQQSTLLRRTILSERSSSLGSDSSRSSLSSSGMISNASSRSTYSNLPSDSMWSYHKAISGGEHYLNSTARSGTPKDAENKLTNHFDSCSLSSVSVYELSSCPSQDSFDKVFSLRDSRRSTSNPFSCRSDSDSSLKMADLISFGSSSKSNMESLNQTDSLPIFPSGITREEEVCLQLIHAENKFISAMQQGVLRFSRPLSHGILSSSEHKILFQNVEKLLAISEYHLKQLSDAWATNADTIQPLGQIYKSQLSMLCESYFTYFRGLSAADELLSELLQKAPFVHFLNQNLPGVPDIRLDIFLQTPQKHLQNLVCIIEEIAAVVDTQQTMFKPLLEVKKGLSNCWKQCISDDQDNKSEESDEGIYDDLDELHMDSPPPSEAGSERFESRSWGRVHGVSEGRRESSSEFGINSDLVQLVKRVQLAKKVKPFQLAVPGRHIIFSGEMDFVDNWKWVRTQVFLMNDIILITKKEANNKLTVITEPVFLKDITGTDFECLHPGEILMTSNTGCREQPWSHMRTTTFRTTAPGLKVTWQHLIKQRLSTINGPPKTAL